MVELDCINNKVERVLINLTKSNESDLLQRSAARYLLQVDSNHPEAISTLIDLFCNSKNEILRWNLDFDDIDNNIDVIRALLKIFFTSQNLIQRTQTGNYLLKILAKEFNLIEKILGLLKIRKSIINMIKIVPNQENFSVFHLKRIITLINLALITKDKNLRRQSFWRLLRIGIDYPEIAKIFLETARAHGDEQRKKIIKFAQKLELNTSETTSLGIELLDIAEDDWLKCSIASRLNKVDPDNPEAIIALKNVLNNCHHENTKGWVADRIKEIEPENQQVVEAFLELLQNTQNWDIARWSAQSLGEMGNNKLEVVQTLFDLLVSTPEQRIADSIVDGLKKVFAADGLALLVTSLKGYLNDETRENNFELYSYAFELLWHCASRMPYPDFYALWHSDETEEE